MPVGKSGRIVIEIDPVLKQELYQSLGKEDSSLKEWFLNHVQGYLSGKSQVPMNFESDDSRQLPEVSS
jgi:hypothetical protein|tara:strand:- start:981 stop:1184 length:204 start_codon:yes stop_codon:yes gene_type:complete